MVEKIKKKWDSQSGESNFTTPGTEGLLVTEGNGKKKELLTLNWKLVYKKKQTE